LARIAPEASIVGEEAAELDRDILRRLGGPLCWIIDPLDGTGNFAAGEGPFGVMVALATHGRPIGAWILDPVGGRFCFAAAGRGAFIDGRQVAAVGKERERPSVALSSLLKRRCDRFEEVVRRLRPAYRLVDIPRCAAELYPAMIEGACQATLFERTLAWDHAAGVLLLEEAGGRCARLDGADYRTDDDRVGLLVATSRKAWEEVAERLRKLPE
jgi:fructose-1,6-bisphosphatase/inositol monophosphatase family enzyme